MSDVFLSRVAARDVDRRAIEEFGIPGIVLMENAGLGCAELLMTLGVSGPVLICAGKGNNGGDGFVIARHLQRHGVTVRVLLFCRPEELRGDAAIEFRILESIRVPIRIVADEASFANLADELASASWIVDALLGTGTRGQIREPFLTAIQSINEAEAPVLSVDLPSGMDCDTGAPLGVCVIARETATFVAPKEGFQNQASRTYTGTVHVIDIGIARHWILP